MTWTGPRFKDFENLNEVLSEGVQIHFTLESLGECFFHSHEILHKSKRLDSSYRWNNFFQISSEDTTNDSMRGFHE